MGLFPFQMAISWLINGGDPNYLRPSWDDPPSGPPTELGHPHPTFAKTRRRAGQLSATAAHLSTASGTLRSVQDAVFGGTFFGGGDG